MYRKFNFKTLHCTLENQIHNVRLFTKNFYEEDREEFTDKVFTVVL